jgi:actin related protein 2/3 complex subunit 5
VEGLDRDGLDTLMKYVYRHLGGGESSNILLKWHECAFEKGGLGCIVRVLAERRTV